MVPAALLSGCDTVLDAVGHELVGRFVRRAMFQEIVPGLDVPDADVFAEQTLDRFANPFIRHALIDITLHGTTKMKVRVVPSIVAYAERKGGVPSSLAFAFAAYLLFMRGEIHGRRRAAGLPVPRDDHDERNREMWHDVTGVGEPGIGRLVRTVCSDVSLWGTDLDALPGFTAVVTNHLVLARRAGVPAALQAHLSAVAA
jgi:tagaturonate reductase